MNNNFEFESASVSDRGLSEKRPENEDSYLELPSKGLFAVADGVGGAQAGDVASQMAMEILGEAFVNYADTVDPEEILLVAIDRANTAIHQMATDLPQLSSMATTIAALHVSGNVATIAHVGDSRVYRVEPHGELRRETDDHSVVEEAVRAGQLTPEQAKDHPKRNIISRALGSEPSVQVDFKTIMVDPGTIFLLCSDGITRHIDDDEISDLLTTGMSPSMLCDQMREICYQRGAEDNLTAVVVKIASHVAQNEAAQEPVTDAEPFDDEETIANIRTPFDAPASDDAVDDSAYLMQDGEEDLLDESHAEDLNSVSENVGEPAADSPDHDEPTQSVAPADYSSSKVDVPASRSAAASSASENDEFSMFGTDSRAKAEREDVGTSMGSKVLSAIVWLVLGSILGVAGYHLWHVNNPIESPTPAVITPQSSDIALSTYEESRRRVDENPEAWANTNAATPQDAVDFYYLGRALLLTGRVPEARRQFQLAKEKISDVDPRDRKTLETDIAIALGLVENPAAVEAFRREVLSPGQPSESPASNAAADTNLAAPTDTAPGTINVAPPANF
ncbi:MAG: serine/threonine-protein phosphatase [Blastocatellia bacterium]|nr:serine/threonine-protein phosphatase [Blastocatellia bacterium]